ncbi:uncharacterized protein METZ01_LOCUS381988 [marine metagenome]|uniref:Uncharacterized protein n=1 Tax=marine metagenome TaxID=408172 RepID=A0A382U4A1_9ZZZZ
MLQINPTKLLSKLGLTLPSSVANKAQRD